MTKENTYSIYIVECIDGTYYTGISTDLQRRIKEHNTNDRQGAKYTKSRRPVHLVFSKSNIKNRKLASIGEYFIKKLTRNQKKLIIDGDEEMVQLLKNRIYV